VSFFLFFGPKVLEIRPKSSIALTLGTGPALTQGMKNTIRIAILVVSITLPFSGARAEDSGQHPLLVTAEKVREGTRLKENTDRQIEQLRAQVRAKKEIISQRQSLISKLDSDQRDENKIATRDQGAGEEARRAREVTARDRYERRQAQAYSLQVDQQNLGQLQARLQQLENYVNGVERTRAQWMATLRQQSEQYRYAAYCQAGMAQQYKPASSFGSFFSGLGKSDAEKNESEIQKILNDAHCVPAQAVSQRRAPKERSLDQVAQAPAQRAPAVEREVRQAVPVPVARSTADSAAPNQQANFENPYGQ
jgi:hypothetical protein